MLAGSNWFAKLLLTNIELASLTNEEVYDFGFSLVILLIEDVVPESKEFTWPCRNIYAEQLKRSRGLNAGFSLARPTAAAIATTLFFCKLLLKIWVGERRIISKRTRRGKYKVLLSLQCDFLSLSLQGIFINSHLT